MQRLLARMFVASTPGMQTAVNAYLVNTGSNLVLVDTGAASCFGPTLGQIVNSLRAAGYGPAQVDTVLLTHLHGDLACGLVSGGQPAFPNATVHVDEADASYWLSEANAAAAGKDNQALFGMARDAVAPYQSRQPLAHLRCCRRRRPVPGVRTVAAYGHTPGHTGYLFTSGKASLLLWGTSSTTMPCSSAARRCRWSSTSTAMPRRPRAAGSSPTRQRGHGTVGRRRALPFQALGTYAGTWVVMSGCRSSMARSARI
ncbi:MBL fold metallo-hydrolase [Cupriavidus basilensis]